MCFTHAHVCTVELLTSTYYISMVTSAQLCKKFHKERTNYSYAEPNCNSSWAGRMFLLCNQSTLFDLNVWFSDLARSTRISVLAGFFMVSWQHDFNHTYRLVCCSWIYSMCASLWLIWLKKSDRVSLETATRFFCRFQLFVRVVPSFRYDWVHADMHTYIFMPACPLEW